MALALWFIDDGSWWMPRHMLSLWSGVRWRRVSTFSWLKLAAYARHDTTGGYRVRSVRRLAAWSCWSSRWGLCRVEPVTWIRRSRWRTTGTSKHYLIMMSGCQRQWSVGWQLWQWWSRRRRCHSRRRRSDSCRLQFCAFNVASWTQRLVRAAFQLRIRNVLQTNTRRSLDIHGFQWLHLRPTSLLRSTDLRRSWSVCHFDDAWRRCLPFSGLSCHVARHWPTHTSKKFFLIIDWSAALLPHMCIKSNQLQCMCC